MFTTEERNRIIEEQRRIERDERTRLLGCFLYLMAGVLMVVAAFAYAC